MQFVLAIDKFLIRFFGISLVNLLITRKAGLPPVTTFLLTTIGRRSGKRIEIPIFYHRAGDGFCVIASKGGAPTHPAWFLNLEANPQAWIWLNGKRREVRARIAAGEERARLWKAAASAYPPYDEYRAKAAPREIPVVVLDPVGAQ